jgi:hypothetical protein
VRYARSSPPVQSASLACLAGRLRPQLDEVSGPVDLDELVFGSPARCACRSRRDGRTGIERWLACLDSV